jgi:hypothetical protein
LLFQIQLVPPTSRATLDRMRFIFGISDSSAAEAEAMAIE